MLRHALALALLTFSLMACAQQGAAPARPASGEAAVRKALADALPNASVDRLRPAPVAGFTEAVVSGRIFYVSNDGAYVFDGTLVDMRNRRNLTEDAMAGLRREALATVPAANRIVFPARDAKYTAVVFTDIDCGYCRMFHSHIAEYNAAGITVEYLFFPRAGQGSESWDKAVSVWCAADQRKAMTDAKAGQPVPKATCDNPIKADFDLGMRVGVSGTPAVYAANGAQLGGYLTPDRLLEALKAQAAAPSASGGAR
jgi:thiol:disulfide interchange protein DsbC